MATFDELRDDVAQALRKRTHADETRAQKLAKAYLTAAVARAHAVTVDASPPPTAFRSAQIGLVLALLPAFEDVPAVDEVAALLRITKTAANSLMNEVQATSDAAVDWSVAAVFVRAKKTAAGSRADLPSANLWTFSSVSDMNIARQRLEFERVPFRTHSEADGQFKLLIDQNYQPPEPR